MKLSDQINRSRIVICLGSGGVGKTTVSAALGIQGAVSGKKTLVLTIDPARRLADALGIDGFAHEPRRIPNDRLADSNHPVSGSLHAMMLDTRHTFDRLIHRYASSEQMRSNILRNRYYRHLSSHLAGSHEYMAMEKLYELHRENRFDLIVLDTPPSRRALDFLDAPERMINLLGDNLFWKIIKPYVRAGKWGMKMVTAFTFPLRHMVGSILGIRVLEDITDFFDLGDNLFFDGFRQRAENVRQLFSDENTSFLIVTSPMHHAVKEAMNLYESLHESKMPFGGYIVNRMPVFNTAMADAVNQKAASENRVNISASLMKKLKENEAEVLKFRADHRRVIETLVKRTQPDAGLVEIPHFSSDINDLQGVKNIRDALNNPGHICESTCKTSLKF